MVTKNARKILAKGAPLLNPDTFVDDESATDLALAAPPSAEPAPPTPPGVVDPDMLAPVLLAQPEGSPARRLLDAIYTRWSEGRPLAFFCEQAGLEFEELVEMVERHYSGIARIHASKHYVEVFEDTAIDAKSRVGMCDRCYATGHVHMEVEGLLMETTKTCPYCEGTRYRRYAGDRHSRAIMFEAMGIVGKSRQPLVAIQQNINVGSEQAGRVGFVQKLLAAGRGK
jgi:hypothetical protein